MNDPIRDANKAHSDLNLFAAIVVLLESSLNSSHTFAAADRIIAICQREQQKCLRRLDRATAKIRLRPSKDT